MPFSDTIEGLKGDLFETFVEPYFKETYRPVRVGDTFLAHGAMRTVEFKVCVCVRLLVRLQITVGGSLPSLDMFQSFSYSAFP